MTNRRHADHELWKGLVAGMIGGAFGSWMMNQYQAGFQKAAKAWNKSDPRTARSGKNRTPKQSQSEDEDATMKMAQFLAEKVLNRQLSHAQKKKAGPIIHYAYGTLAGGAYGAAAEFMPEIRKAVGMAYGTALFVGGDEVGVPMMHLSESPTSYPLSVHVNALASHLVYGFSVELARRAVRAIL
ncbi:MAG TPA: DUF1440 domain-containing protein [Terriglobales bacterium]|jgi:uncharacterized membrane protein YagU involved in acid resistance|nr:DUF1440 domain-containing protein [Terriglobales bacterium]